MAEDLSPSQGQKNLPAGLPAEIRKLLSDPKKSSEIRAFFASYSGPLPSPEALREYNSVLDGLAERIVKMAEAQSAHRIELEKGTIREQLLQSKRGQWLGFSIALICLAITVWLALMGHDEVAKVIGGGTLGSLVIVFVTGKWQQRSDLRRKG